MSSYIKNPYVSVVVCSLGALWFLYLEAQTINQVCLHSHTEHRPAYWSPMIAGKIVTAIRKPETDVSVCDKWGKKE